MWEIKAEIRCLGPCCLKSSRGYWLELSVMMKGDGSHFFFVFTSWSDAWAVQRLLKMNEDDFAAESSSSTGTHKLLEDIQDHLNASVLPKRRFMVRTLPILPLSKRTHFAFPLINALSTSSWLYEHQRLAFHCRIFSFAKALKTVRCGEVRIESNNSSVCVSCDK